MMTKTGQLSLIPVCKSTLADCHLAEMTKLGALVTLARVKNLAPRTKIPFVDESTIFQATVLEWFFSRDGNKLILTVDILSAPAIFKAGKVVLKFDVANGCCPIPPELLA